MQKLFNMDRIGNPGSQSVAGWAHVREQLRKNLERVITYNQVNASAVNAAHILNRIIITLAEGNYYAPRLYDDLLTNSVQQYAGSLGLTSSVSKGLIHDGAFYGKGSREIIIAHNARNYTVDEVCKNWKDVAAVEVLHHPYTDLTLPLADGELDLFESSFAVIAINFNILGLQYKMFKENEDRLAAETGKPRRTLQQFIHCYVLTNMLHSHLDYVIFNRLNATFFSQPISPIKPKHPFGLIDIAHVLNQVQGQQLKMLNKSSYGFLEILNTIGAVTKDNLYQVSELPKMAHTRQVVWALIPARLKMLSFVLNVAGEMGRALNRTEIDRIQVNFRALNSARVLKAALPADVYGNLTKHAEEALPGA